MKRLSKYSDIIFLGAIVSVIVIGSGILVNQWRVWRDGWRTDFDEYSVDPDEFVAGGMGRDNRIVPIDEPVFVNIEAASVWLHERTPVIVIDYYGAERAYPLTILAIHEIVNDDINGTPVAVTFCPLCNSAIVYHRELNGQVLRMGISGNLYGNNFLMYDDLTESWWYQFTGEAVVGEMTGEMLDIVPSQVVGFGSYVNRYPNGVVLAGDAQRPELNYNVNPYVGYEGIQSPVMTGNVHDPRLNAMQRVLAVEINDTQMAYPFSVLRDVGVINDNINGNDVVVFWQPGAVGLGASDNSYDNDVGQAGLFGREIDGLILTFRYADGRIFDEQTNSEWNIFGEAISGDYEGRRLYDYNCFTHFWFAWSSAYPDTLVYEQ